MNVPPVESFAKVWREDAGFRARVVADPQATLREWGLPIPAGIAEVRVVENTAETVHLAFPPDPGGTLSDAELEQVAGGTGGSLGRDPYRWVDHSSYHGWSIPNG